MNIYKLEWCYLFLLADGLQLNLLLTWEQNVTTGNYGGTIFEGVTHKIINLDAIKEPEVFIEKKARRSGQGDEGYKSEDEDKPSAAK